MYLHTATKWNVISVILLVTVQRQCCVCWGVWRRWAMWVSGLCFPATAAWPPGGRERHGGTKRAALCTPPASHGLPPLPRPRHLQKERTGLKRKQTNQLKLKSRHSRQTNSELCFWHIYGFDKFNLCNDFRSIRTSALENIAASPFEPGHMFKAQEGGVHAEAWATLPHPVNITGTNFRYQGNWEEDWRAF